MYIFWNLQICKTIKVVCWLIFFDDWSKSTGDDEVESIIKVAIPPYSVSLTGFQLLELNSGFCSI